MQSLSVKFHPNERSLRDVEKALAGYPAALQDKIVRNALRRWCKGTQQLAASQTKKATGKVARSLRVKVKAYDRGRIMWAAVGHGDVAFAEADKLRGRARAAIWGGAWRAHFVEFGFHQWSPQWSMNEKQRDVRRKRKSKFGEGKGSGWRLGRYHRGRGTFYRGTEPLTHAGRVRASVLLPLIIAEVDRHKNQLARAARAGKARL